MVTFNRVEYRQLGESAIMQHVQPNYVEGVCLSTDEKPTGFANGSIMKEMDTGKLYMYDAANEIWREWE